MEQNEGPMDTVASSWMKNMLDAITKTVFWLHYLVLSNYTRKNKTKQTKKKKKKKHGQNEISK